MGHISKEKIIFRKETRKQFSLFKNINENLFFSFPPSDEIKPISAQHLSVARFLSNRCGHQIRSWASK